MLTPFKLDEEVYLDANGVMSLVSKLRFALDEISEQYLGQKVGFSERVGVTGFKYG